MHTEHGLEQVSLYYSPFILTFSGLLYRDFNVVNKGGQPLLKLVFKNVWIISLKFSPEKQPRFFKEGFHTEAKIIMCIYRYGILFTNRSIHRKRYYLNAMTLMNEDCIINSLYITAYG